MPAEGVLPFVYAEDRLERRTVIGFRHRGIAFACFSHQIRTLQSFQHGIVVTPFKSILPQFNDLGIFGSGMDRTEIVRREGCMPGDRRPSVTKFGGQGVDFHQQLKLHPGLEIDPAGIQQGLGVFFDGTNKPTPPRMGKMRIEQILPIIGRIAHQSFQQTFQRVGSPLE